MSSKITFHKKRIFYDRDEIHSTRYIAEYIAAIVEGHREYVFPIHETRWEIGNGNNFWLSWDNDSYVLQARDWNETQLNAVRTILEAQGLC